jgi:hypothetical protein
MEAVAVLLGFGLLAWTVHYWAHQFYRDYRYSLLLDDLPNKLNDLRLGNRSQVSLWPIASLAGHQAGELMALTGRVRSLWLQTGDSRAISVSTDGAVTIACDACRADVAKK